MRTSFTLFFIILLALNSFAQSKAELLPIEIEAQLAMDKEDFNLAIELYEAALEERKMKYPEQGYLEGLDAIREVSNALDHLIYAHFQQGNVEERLELSKVHVSWLEEAMALDSEDHKLKLDHIFSSLRVIEGYQELGDLMTALRQSNKLIESLEQDTTNKAYRVAIKESLPYAYSRRGDILNERKDTKLSIQDHEKSFVLFDQLYAALESDIYLEELGRQAHILVKRYDSVNDSINALNYAYEASDVYGILIENNPDNESYMSSCILANNGVAGYLIDRGEKADGVKFYEKSVALNERLYEKTGDADRGLQIAAISFQVWKNFKELSYLHQGVVYLEKRIKILEELEQRFPANDYSFTITRNQYDLAEAYKEIGDLKSSLHWINESIISGNRSIEKDPTSVPKKQYMFVREHKRFEIHKEMGAYDKASNSLDKLNAIFEQLEELEPGEDYSEQIKDVEITQTELAYPEIVRLDGRIDKVENKETKFGLQKKLLKLIQKKMKKDEKLVASYIKHTNAKAWDGLFIQQFKASEKDIRKAMKLNTRDPYLITNLAPSLLFQGKYEEATEVYMKNYKKPFRPGEIILDGFLADMEEFEAENIIPSAHKQKAMAMKKKLEALRK